MTTKTDADWTLIPASVKEIEQVRERCRRLVRRRAMISAGVAAVPIPGIDVVSDLGLFARMIDDINLQFGLTHQQIDRMQPQLKLIAYQAAVGMGGMLVGKFITRELVLQVLRHGGMKVVARQAAKMVPLAGQLVSAAIGFAVLKRVGYQHVEACAVVAQELLAARAL